MKKVRYEEMFPHEFEETMRETPIAYLPLGTLEWHGLHLALGNDAVKANELCLRVAAITGGVVVPPTFWAIGGMPQPWTTRFDEGLISQLFYGIFEQLSQVGFKVIVAVTGHYGIEQVLTLKREALKFMQKSNVIIFPIAEYEVTADKGYRGDHAAKWETSILWYLRPELVDVEQISKAEKTLNIYDHGIIGEDPRVSASQELGKEIVTAIVNRLAETALRLLKETSQFQRSMYVTALSKQVQILDGNIQAQLRKKGNEAKRETYYQLLNLVWKGKYVEAIKTADALLAELT
jgi:creatinine amidohydrolase